MIQHLIAYEGKFVSLAVMQEEYIHLFAPWPNRRIGVEGTLQRPPYSIERGLEWVRSLDGKRGVHEVFAILVHVETEHGREYLYVGHTGLHNITWPDARCTSGSVIGHPEGRMNGYGTEAKLLLLYHAFMVLGLRKVCSEVKAFNAASLGHLLKCGYQVYGRDPQQIFHEGEYVDEFMLGVFRKDWEPIWQKYQKTGKLPKLTKRQRAYVSKETTT
jgi:RimJ/RimL family protein N-acetyltransferase